MATPFIGFYFSISIWSGSSWKVFCLYIFVSLICVFILIIFLGGFCLILRWLVGVPIAFLVLGDVIIYIEPPKRFIIKSFFFTLFWEMEMLLVLAKSVFWLETDFLLTLADIFLLTFFITFLEFLSDGGPFNFFSIFLTKFSPKSALFFYFLKSLWVSYSLIS